MGLYSRIVRLVPSSVRQVPGHVYAWNRNRLVRSRRERVPPTVFPLPGEERRAIQASFDREKFDAPYATRADAAFPDEAELQSLWGMIRAMVHCLGPVNPYDKYFQSARLEDEWARRDLRIHKDLFVAWLAAHKQPKSMLEIGCRTGRSFVAYLINHPQPKNCTSILIDPFIEMGSPVTVRKNIEFFGLPTEHTHLFVGYSERIVPAIAREFPGVRYEYVLVDGSHERDDALRDLRMIHDLVAPGGYVVFDDIGRDSYGLIDVWNEWKEAVSDAYEFREYDERYAFAAAHRIA